MCLGDMRGQRDSFVDDDDDRLYLKRPQEYPSNCLSKLVNYISLRGSRRDIHLARHVSTTILQVLRAIVWTYVKVVG